MAETKIRGQETPRAGCLHENGFNICNYGEATIRETFLTHHDLLGDPVTGFDSRCQIFEYGALCYDPGKPKDWKVEWDNLGQKNMLANGFTPQLGSEGHPAVRDWIQFQLDQGVDTPRVIGPIISPPLRSPGTNTCKQWTAKTAFTFPCEATSGTQVQRVPLGLQSIPAPVPTPVATLAITESPLPQPTFNPAPWVLGGLVVVLLLVLLLTRLKSEVSGSLRRS